MNGLEVARERLTDDGEPPLSFEQWRALAPRLSGREADERETMLAAAEIEPATWDRADGYWSLTLAAECARGERARAEDFGRACAEEQESRKKASSIRADDTWPEGIAPPALAETAPSGATPFWEGGEAVSRAEVPELPVLASRGPLAELPAFVPRVEVVVPTFLRAEAAPMGAAVVRAEAAPVRPAAWPSVVVAPSPPAPALRTAETTDLPPFALAPARPLLPFAAASGRPPVPAPSPRPALPPPSGLTLDLSGVGLPPPPAPPSPPSGALHASGSTGRDRRTEAGTVALDPAALDSLFGRKPSK